MQAGSQTNALAEIALALSMGFFSIMVLTMVSMGAERAGIADNPAAGKGVAVVESRQSKSRKNTSVSQAQDKDIIIYFKGRFFDGRLKQLSPGHLRSKTEIPKRKLILAVDPKQSMQETISVRSRLSGRELIVTTLTEDWLKRIKETEK